MFRGGQIWQGRIKMYSVLMNWKNRSNVFEKNCPDKADALLMAQGQAVNRKTKSLSPVKTKKLRNSWRLKKVKLYKGGTVRVVRIQSGAPHAHLVEYGTRNISMWKDTSTREKIKPSRVSSKRS